MLRRWRGNTFRSWRDRLLERYDSIASDGVPDLCHEELLGASKIEAGTRPHHQSSRSRWSPNELPSRRKHRVAKKEVLAPLALGSRLRRGEDSQPARVHLRRAGLERHDLPLSWLSVAYTKMTLGALNHPFVGTRGFQ
jgi:hypothetical protein